MTYSLPLPELIRTLCVPGAVQFRVESLSRQFPSSVNSNR